MAASWFWGDEWAARRGPHWAQWFDDLPLVVRLLTEYGVWLFYAGYAAVLASGLWRQDIRLLKVLLIYLVAQLAFSVLVVRAMKIGFGRPRAFLSGAEWKPFTLESDFHSLPSGHSADVAVGLSVTMRAFASWSLRLGALALALVVAAGRVVQNKHYPSDVVVGLMVGHLGTVLTTWAVLRGALTKPAERLLFWLTHRAEFDSKTVDIKEEVR